MGTVRLSFESLWMNEDRLCRAHRRNRTLCITAVTIQQAAPSAFEESISANGQGYSCPKPKNAIVVQISAEHTDGNTIEQQPCEHPILQFGGFQHSASGHREQTEEGQQQSLSNYSFFKRGLEKEVVRISARISAVIKDAPTSNSLPKPQIVRDGSQRATIKAQSFST